MAFSIHFLAFILLAVSLGTKPQVEHRLNCLITSTGRHTRALTTVYPVCGDLIVVLDRNRNINRLQVSSIFSLLDLGCPFSAAVACNHYRSRVNFLHLAKIKTFIRSRPSRTFTFIIVVLSGDIQVNPGRTSIYPCGCCELPVTWDHQRAVCCDNCELCYHSECIELSSSRINVLQSSNVSWICCHCESVNVDSLTYHSREFEPSSRFSVLSDSSSELSVDSWFCPKTCSTPIPKLDKPCLIEDPVKSNDSIKVNQVKSESNSCILIRKKQDFGILLMNYKVLRTKGHHSLKVLIASNLML